MTMEDALILLAAGAPPCPELFKHQPAAGRPAKPVWDSGTKDGSPERLAVQDEWDAYHSRNQAARAAQWAATFAMMTYNELRTMTTV